MYEDAAKLREFRLLRPRFVMRGESPAEFRGFVRKRRNGSLLAKGMTCIRLAWNGRELEYSYV